ncbi:hypothetical protein D7035_19405, partial [Aquimarina sp. AD1]
NKEFLSFYDNIFTGDTMDLISQKIPPLLFVNTTHTQTGNYNIISPVEYSQVKEFTGMNDFLSTIQSSYPNNSIALSTAMRINASFPFITPVGEVRNRTQKDIFISDQYADAGYYDNIGGRVSIGVEEVLKKVLNDSFPLLRKKVKIKQLIITNEEELKIAKTSTQLSAPLTTLKNVRYGHTKEVMEKLGDDYVISLKQTEIMPFSINLLTRDINKEELFIRPVLPLGRYLSTVAIRSMEARLDSVKVDLDLITQ